MTLALPFARGSDTSRDAAEDAGTHAAQDRGRILAFIGQRGTLGATADEILAALRFAHQTAASRVSDLKREGLIVDTGQRRRTRAGNKAAVYTLNPNPVAIAKPRRPSRVVVGQALAEIKALLHATQREQGPALKALADWLIGEVRR